MTMRRFCHGNYEIEKQQETANLLYQLLCDACQERDEAREKLKKSMAEISELKKLLNMLLPSNNSAETSSYVAHYNSSAADSIARTFVQEPGGRIQMGNFSSNYLLIDYHASKVMDTLIKGRPLPEKGKFFEAVLDTVPLLETLMITGQLPKWRNPPTFSSNLVDAEDHHGLINLQKASIDLKSAIHGSSMLSSEKRSNSGKFEPMEQDAIRKKLR